MVKGAGIVIRMIMERVKIKGMENGIFFLFKVDEESTFDEEVEGGIIERGLFVVFGCKGRDGDIIEGDNVKGTNGEGIVVGRIGCGFEDGGEEVERVGVI